MDQDQVERMTPFDELVTSPTLQIIKLLIPYTPFPGCRMLASFIKFIEFQKTVQIFTRNDSQSDLFFNRTGSQNISSPFDLIDSMRPYLTPKDAEMLDALIKIKEIMSFMETMQPQGDSTFDPSDLFSSMFPSDFQEQFRMYSDLFSSDNPETQETTHPSPNDNASCDSQHSMQHQAPSDTSA